MELLKLCFLERSVAWLGDFFRGFIATLRAGGNASNLGSAIGVGSMVGIATLRVRRRHRCSVKVKKYRTYSGIRWLFFLGNGLYQTCFFSWRIQCMLDWSWDDWVLSEAGWSSYPLILSNHVFDIFCTSCTILYPWFQNQLHIGSVCMIHVKAQSAGGNSYWCPSVSWNYAKKRCPCEKNIVF